MWGSRVLSGAYPEGNSHPDVPILGGPVTAFTIIATNEFQFSIVPSCKALARLFNNSELHDGLFRALYNR